MLSGLHTSSALPKVNRPLWFWLIRFKQANPRLIQPPTSPHPHASYKAVLYVQVLPLPSVPRVICYSANLIPCCSYNTKKPSCHMCKLIHDGWKGSLLFLRPPIYCMEHRCPAQVPPPNHWTLHHLSTRCRESLWQYPGLLWELIHWDNVTCAHILP